MARTYSAISQWVGLHVESSASQDRTISDSQVYPGCEESFLVSCRQDSSTETINPFDSHHREYLPFILSHVSKTLSAYLSPQIGRYNPDLVNHWRALQQSSAAHIAVNRREEILSKVNSIFAARQHATKVTGETETSVEDLLAEVQKLPTTCQMDSVYAHAVFELSHKKDFRASSFCGR